MNGLKAVNPADYFLKVSKKENLSDTGKINLSFFWD